MGVKKLELSAANNIVYFAQKFTTGQSYSITQVSGPRTCNMLDGYTGTITNGDVLLFANCGNPPLTIYKLNLIGVESGETFSFKDNYRRTFSTSFSTIANLGGFPRGDQYVITQTSGPRECIITPNTGTVTETPLTIQCDCRKIYRWKL